MRHPILGCLTVALVSACVAAGPQDEAARAEASLSLWPLTTSSDEARQRVTDGVREADMNRVEEAYENFERAIAADPNAAMPHLYSATVAFGVATVEATYAHLEQAAKLSDHASEVEKLIIQSIKKGFDNDDSGALTIAQQLVKIDSENPRSWLLLAGRHGALQQRADERAAVDKAIELAPGFALAYITQSISYTNSEPRDLAKAEANARKAVELEPNEPDVHDILGDALRAQGKLEEAAQAYTRAAELDPTKGDGLQQRGHVQTFLGRYAEARADYDAAVALAVGNRKPVLWVYRAFVNLYEGNARAAVEELEQIYNAMDGIEMADPTGIKIFVVSQQAAVALHNHMIPEAERATGRLVQLKSQLKVNSEEFRRAVRSQIALDQGYLAWTKADYATARQKAAEYMKIREPDSNPTRNRSAHELLGMIALEEGRHADAVSEFEQGSPDDIYMDYHHALALEGAGRGAEAQKLYEKIANYYFNPVGMGLVRKDALAKVKNPAT